MQSRMGEHLRLLLVVNLIFAATADFTSNCPHGCKCVWASGNKLANCSHSNLLSIPKNLSADIQNLDLGYSTLYEISSNAFEDVHLINLKKLYLRECRLGTIHRDGFSGLTIMIELDLSKNALKILHADTFAETSKIRWIILNDNQLEKLEDGLFSNLPFLQLVQLSNNHLYQISIKTFFNVPKLNTLELDGNRLEYLKVDTLNALSLINLKVHDNPWRCDCYLQSFRNWVISKHLYTLPITCQEPANLRGKTWKDVDSSDFTCYCGVTCAVVHPSNRTTIRSSDINIILSCQVNGNSLPEVTWVPNSQIINDSYQEDIKHIIFHTNKDNSRWVNLTIIEAATDNGESFCSAKNPGGVKKRNLTLVVTHIPSGMLVSTGKDNNKLPVLIGIFCTAAILLLCLVILCYCCCRRRTSNKKKAATTNKEALIEGYVTSEMEKSLITAVKPVETPPRSFNEPPSITSGKISEFNKTLGQSN